MKMELKKLAPMTLTLTAFALQGCGSDPTSRSSEPQAPQDANQVSNEQNANYVVAKKVTLSGFHPQSGDPLEVNLEEGTEVMVLETKVDQAHGTLVRLGIDAEEGSVTDLWVPLDQKFLESVEHLAPDLQTEEEIDEPSGILETVRRTRRGMTYCYRFVKNYLLSSGKVRSYLPGSSAWQAASILPKHGFRRTGNSPASAGNGEVCVYSGGPRGHGHIEVKRNGKWWYGYGYKSEPMSGRRFIGCFAK